MFSIGNDIIEVSRIEKNINTHGDKFLNRLFTPAEQAYCNQYRLSARHYAGRFAAKEAVAKALGSGFGAHLAWLDFEIINNPSGKPIVHFLNQKTAAHFGYPSIQLSISHCQEYATAVALLIRT